MAIKIGSLQVDLRLLSTRFDAGMKEATTSLGRFGTQVSKVSGALGKFSGGIAALAGLGGVGLGAVTRQAIDYADAIGKTADRLGVSTDALQTWRFAASQSGVDIGTLETAMQRLGRRVGQVAEFNKGPAKEALQVLGVSITDITGRTRDLEDIMADVAAAISKVDDENRALALTQKLVDSEGVKLINTFREVNDQFFELQDNARRSGAVLEESVIRQAEIASSQMDFLATILKTQLADALLANVSTWVRWGESIIGTVKDVSDFLQQQDQNLFNQLVGRRETIEEQIGLLVQNKDTNFIPDFLDTRKLEDLSLELAEVNAQIQQMSEARINAQKAEEAARQRLVAFREQLAAGRGGGGEGEGDNSEEERRQREIISLEAQLERKFLILNESLLTEEERLKIHFENRLLIIEDAYVSGIIPTEQRYRELLETVEAQHQAKMGELVQKGLTQRQKFQALSYRRQAQTIFGELENITQGVAQQNKTLFRVNQIAGIANALINTWIGVSQTLAAYPWPISGVMAAAHLAAGLATVAQIKSASFGGGNAAPSLAGAGAVSGTVPTLSVDDQVGTQRGVGTAVEPVREVNITLQGAGYGKQEVRELIEQINEEIGDGVKLAVA